jgi:benzylsuccinate CoA-transferase BbsF subunit
MSKKMLEGLKVVDFTTVIAGPFITKTMAAHGAEVIKIESRTHPDLWRGGMFSRNRKQAMAMSGMVPDDLKPFSPWMNTGVAFGFWNTGKQSIALDLAKPKAVELAKQLVARADIVVENFAGGVAKRMGLGYEELKKVKPDIIMLSSCMQGQTGPHAKHPGYGTQLVNLSGLSGISGWPDREPAAIGPYTDFTAPQFSLLAIMAALDYRRRAGKGQYIDLSQYESTIHLMAPLVLDNQVNNRITIRVGNRSPSSVPHNAYPCKKTHADRYVAIGVYTPEEWKGFCEAIGNLPWTQDPKFATLKARRQNVEELDRLIEEWTLEQLPEDIVRRMQNAEEPVPSCVVASKEEFYHHIPRAKNRSPYAAPHNAYHCRCEDRWCVIAVSTEEEWTIFCKVIGNPAWTKDSRFATFKARKENEEALDQFIGEWTMNHSPKEVMEMMQNAGVAAGVVATGEDVMVHDPQMAHRRFYQKLHHPEIKDHQYRGVTPSFILSKNPAEVKRAPLMGEHNESILKEILGLSDEDIEQLILEEVLN